MEYHSPYITILVTVKNERENVSLLVKEIVSAFSPTGMNFEILYVDDGSTDDTYAVILETQKSTPQLRAVQLDKNYGQSTALLAGIKESHGELVATLDGDLQNDPADFTRMIQMLEERSLDMVTGIRSNRHDSTYRRFQSRIANSVRNMITGDDIVDSACAVRVFRRKCVDDIARFKGMHRFMPTLFRMAGYRVEQVSVNHRQRKFGTTKYGMLNRVFKATSDLFAVRWLQKNFIRYSITRRD